MTEIRTYRRVLTRFDATMIVIGSIIGGGIFFTPQAIASTVGADTTLILLAWAIGGLIAMTGALTYAGLGGLFPRTGGVYVFLREAFGGLPAFLYTWALLLVIAPGALIVAGLAFAGGAPGDAAAAAPARARDASAAGLLLAAMMPVLFSYGGWQNGTYIAGEMRAPGRDVPAAVLIGTLVVVAVYLLVNVSALRVLGPHGVAASRAFAADAAERAMGPAGRGLVTAGILVSTFGICAAIPLTNPRVVQATAADGFFLAPFARLHARFATPAWAIVVLGAWSCALLLLGTAEQLLDAVVFADWVFFALSGLALFVFRRRLPGAARPYRCALYPWVPAAFTALAITVAAGAYATADARSRLLGPGVLALGALALGALVYAWQARGGRGAQRAPPARGGDADDPAPAERGLDADDPAPAGRGRDDGPW